MEHSKFQIDFNHIPEEYVGKGVKQKQFVRNGKQIRWVRFDDKFIEDDWCDKGHVGFVLNGEMKIDFNGKIVSYKTGDGLWIEEGELSKHKLKIASKGFVELVLFEEFKQ